MDISLIIYVVVSIAVITMLYKSLPHRDMDKTKPFISLFPKFKTKVKLPSALLESGSPEEALETVLTEYGFNKKKKMNSVTKYSRGHILGDISIKLAKVNLLVTEPTSGYAEISIEAAWVVAFDTGDFWKFLTELKYKIENKI